ncbi:MAG: M48 family metalloprotease [Balneolaceae bacterium]
MKSLIKYCLLIFSIVFLAGCAIQKNPVSGSTRAFGYSWEQELRMGEEADPEIVAQFGLYDDSDMADYVVEIGETVLSESHMRRSDTESKFRETEFTFRILDSPVINAFALPGGYVYFTRGMMAHLSNEAQLAVVMGHEIGHVAARHASQRALRQTVGQIASVGGAVLGQEILGLPGQTLLNLSSTAAELLFLSYSRDNERESDRLGVEYASMAGYEAAEGSALFTSLKRISEMHGQSVPNFVSTHPDPGEREETIPQLAEEWSERGYEQTVLNEDRYMELIDGLVFGENPRHGFEEDGMFYHPELAFRFPVPGGWQLINQPSQVVLLSPEEDAVSIFRIDSESATPRQAVEAIISESGIESVREEQALSSGEWEAWMAEAHAAMEDGTPLTLLVYAVEYENNIYRFLSYTGRDQYSTYEADFIAISESFDSLTDPGILDTRPVRINLTRADRSDSFESFLPDELPMDINPQEVAIINQVEMDDQIEAGQWLKIPVQE